MKSLDTQISRHLLIYITIGFCTGIVIGYSLQFPPVSFTHLFALSLLVFLLCAFSLMRKSPATTQLFLLFFFFVAGIVHINAHLQPPGKADHIYNQIEHPTEGVIAGTMVSMATFDGRSSRIVFDLKAIRKSTTQVFTATDGMVVLYMKGEWPKQHLPGDELIIKARMKRPRSFASPGSFDYAQYLAQKGIWVTGYIKSPTFIAPLHSDNEVTWNIKFLSERIRAHLVFFIDDSLRDPMSGMYKALLLGDRASVPEHVLEFFKASGTLHILAISGIHMAIVGSFFYLIIYWLLSRSEYLLLHFPIPRLTALCTLPPLIFYALITGMNSPATRAVLMSAIVILGILSLRKCSPGSLIATAAFIILFLDPLQLFTASFQLSFAAVCGILFFIPHSQVLLSTKNGSGSWKNIPKRVSLWLLAALLVSTAATLVTLPVSIIHFHRISLIGPLTNLVVEPVLCLWALPLGIISIPFTYYCPVIGDFLLSIGSWGIEVALVVTKFFSSFSFSNLWLPTPPRWCVAIYYGTVLVLLWHKRPNVLLIISSALMFCGCLIIILFPHIAQQDTHLSTPSITFLDVGQGSATLVEFKSGEKILIDGGGSAWSRVTVGEKVIAPYLWSRGVNRLDSIVITHPDSDHCNGIEFIIEHFKPKTLWLRNISEQNPQLKPILQKAALHNTRVAAPSSGQLLSRQGNKIECLYNFEEVAGSRKHMGKRSKENAGLIIKVCIEKHCVLFPGDISTVDEQHLINNGISLNADILLAAHHGAKTSNSDEFLKATTPSYVIVSAGSGRPKYFPHPSLIQKCSARGLPLLTTASMGTIEFLGFQSTAGFFTYNRPQENPIQRFQRTRLMLPQPE